SSRGDDSISEYDKAFLRAKPALGQRKKKAAALPEVTRRRWNKSLRQLRLDASLREERRSGVLLAQAFGDLGSR
ncbi:MAG: hypothetical protein ACWGMZ_12490, partial [Thermoguttaceae bacterium]